MFKGYKESIIKCNECKLLLEKKDAQVINISQLGLIDDDDFKSQKYYCPVHNKPYSKIILDQFDTFPFSKKYRYYKEVEVDKNGKIIK